MDREKNKIEINTTISAPAGATVHIDTLQAAQSIHNNTIIQPTPAASVLPTVWNAPLENSSYFERAHTKYIKDHMQSPKEGSTALCMVAISGLGGVGKTELAKNYFYHPGKNYTAKLWFTADSREHLESEYRLLAQELKLIEKDAANDLIKQKLFTFFAEHPGWLIILDNVDNPAVILDLLPRQGGDLLITSRNPNWQGRTVNVDVLASDEAVLFYKKLTSKNDEAIEELVVALGCLPLAIAQAAAYVAQNKSIDTKNYLKRFNEYRKDLLSKNSLPASTKADKDRLTVMTTWNLSIDALEREFKDPEYNFFLTKELLISCAYLASKNIPVSLFTSWTKIVYEQEAVDMLVDEAIRQLTSHSLIQCDVKFIQVHRLVQEVIRLQNPLIQQRRVALAQAMEAENKEDNSNMHNVQQRLKLIPHLEALISYWTVVLEQQKAAKQEYSESEMLFGVLLHFLGRLYLIQGSSHLAQPLLEKSLEIDGKYSDDTSVSFLTGLRNLGHAYLSKDDAASALVPLNRALAILTSKNIDELLLADVLGDLGQSYALLDQYEKGREFLQRAVKIQEERCGPNHIKLARNLCNLGRIWDKFDSKEAHRLLERALAIQEAHYKQDHFEILPTLFGLSDTGVLALNSPEFAAVVRRAYTIAVIHYGQNHPETAIIASKLALSCAHRKEWVESRDVLLRDAYKTVCDFPLHGKDGRYAKIIVSVASSCYLMSAEAEFTIKKNKKAAVEILFEGLAWLPNRSAFLRLAAELLEKNHVRLELATISSSTQAGNTQKWDETATSSQTNNNNTTGASVLKNK